MDTIYKASVNIGNSSNRVRIYFLFAKSKLGGRSVSIGEGIYTGPEWQVYHITTATEVHHTCPEGTWILYLYPDRSPEWALRKKDGHMCEPIICLANEPKMKGQHYDALIIDDMNIGELESYEDYKKKGDDKMSKYLWHVILFNTDTEQIDFKGYIPACSDNDARMMAAQTFGKFDPKVHAVNCKQIMSYGKED